MICQTQVSLRRTPDILSKTILLKLNKNSEPNKPLGGGEGFQPSKEKDGGASSFHISNQPSQIREVITAPVFEKKEQGKSFRLTKKLRY